MLPAAIQSAHSSMQHHQTRTHQRSSSKPAKDIAAAKHAMEHQQAQQYTSRHAPAHNRSQSYPLNSFLSSTPIHLRLWEQVANAMPAFSLSMILHPQFLMSLVVIFAFIGLTIPVPDPDAPNSTINKRGDTIGTAEHVYRYHVEHHSSPQPAEPTEQLAESFVPLEESEDSAEPYIMNGLSKEDHEWGSKVVKNGGKTRFASNADIDTRADAVYNIEDSSDADMADMPESDAEILESELEPEALPLKQIESDSESDASDLSSTPEPEMVLKRRARAPKRRKQRRS